MGSRQLGVTCYIGDMSALQLVAAIPDSDQSLTLDFSQQGDRFITSVLLNSDGPVSLAESVEGPAENGVAAWPRSAPLQEIIPQTIDGVDILAGIGMAGKSHWSVIIRPLQGRPGFDFEFACRVKELPDFLGSTYRLSTAPPSQRSELRAESSNAAIEAADGLLVIRPRIASDATLPTTIQWQYQLVLEV